MSVVNTSTSAGIAQRSPLYPHAVMLKTAIPQVVLDRFAETKQMPAHRGTKMVFRRPVPFEPSITPLKEGVTPTPRAFRFEDVEGTLEEYGFVTDFTNRHEEVHEDTVVESMLEHAGLNLAREQELLRAGAVIAGTAVHYANGASRAAVNTPITVSLQQALTRNLARQKARLISRALTASEKYGTGPVAPSFIAFGHTDLRYDIERMPGFLEVERYASGMAYPFEIGKVKDIRYILTADFPSWKSVGGTPTGVLSGNGTAADVYPIVVIGADSYATVPLRGKNSVDPTVIRSGVKTKDDPLGQRGKIGYRHWHLTLITNQSWLARMEVAVTSL